MRGKRAGAKIFVHAVILWLLAGPAFAGQDEDAGAAFERGDYATALRLLRPLAEQGDANAQIVLGAMYQEGLGAPQDYAQAEFWLCKAALQGGAMAQFFLGNMYYEGPGERQDYSQAAHWFRKAAAQGMAMAQFYLGDMYAEGQGVTQDFVLALMWLNLAADGRRMPDEASQKMATIERDDTAAEMTPDQIARAQRLAREWKPSVKTRKK
jgi:TPR repeat protein